MFSPRERHAVVFVLLAEYFAGTVISIAYCRFLMEYEKYYCSKSLIIPFSFNSIFHVLELANKGVIDCTSTVCVDKKSCYLVSLWFKILNGCLISSYTAVEYHTNSSGVFSVE